MYIKILILILIGVPIGTIQAASVIANSTFNADAENWSTMNAAAIVSYNAEGYICTKDSFWKASSIYSGNLEIVYGGNLTFDLQQLKNDAQSTTYDDVILIGNDLSLTYNIQYSPYNTWINYTIPLIATSDWKVADTAQVPTAMQMRNVLKNLSAILIRGNFGDNAVSCIDNVTLSQMSMVESIVDNHTVNVVPVNGGVFNDLINDVNCADRSCTEISNSIPIIPTVVTNPVTNIAANSATLNGYIQSNGATAIVTFDLGLTPEYGTTIAAVPGQLYGNTAVTAIKSDLNCATTYHYRAKAVNSIDTGYGVDQVFTTLNCQTPRAFSTSIIQSVAATQTLNGGRIANLALTAANSNNVLDAWVVIERPDYQLDSTQTFASLPTVTLSKNSTNPALWVGRYATGDIGSDGDIQRGPDVRGTYKLNYYVESNDGVISTPMSGSIIQNVGLIAKYTTPVLLNVNQNRLDFPIAQLWTTGLSRSLFTRASSTSLFQLNNLVSLASTGIVNTNPPLWNATTNVINIPRLIKNNDIQYYKGTLTRISSAGTENQWTFNLSFVSDVIPPNAVTNAATNITYNSALLNGVVNDNGAATIVNFEFGTTKNYGSIIAAVPSAIALGTGNKAVTAGKSNLTCNSLYHYRIKAVNKAGTRYGIDKTFTTAACVPPTVNTGVVKFAVTTGITTLSGAVAPRGSITTVTFNYGLTTAYGTTLVATPSPISSGDGTLVTATIAAGLTCGVTYHYRIAAINSSGTALGVDRNFVACSDKYELEEVSTIQAAVIWVVDPSLPQPLPSDWSDIEIPQWHTIHTAQDVDWFIFETSDFNAYEISTLTPQGSPLNLKIELFNSQNQLLKSANWNVAGECDPPILNYAECETLTFFLANFNLVAPQQLRMRISATNYQDAGQLQSYRIVVRLPYLAAAGTLLGQVRTATGAIAPLGTRVTSSNGSRALTNSNGRYLLDHVPGQFNFTTLSITKPKYINTSVNNYLYFP